MPYKLTARDIGTIVNAIYEAFDFVADQLQTDDDFPILTLEHWKQRGLVEKAAIPEMFSYCDSRGNQVFYNAFIFSRIELALETGGTCIEDIITTALEAPLLYPDEFAIRVASRNMRTYLTAMGSHDLMCHHDEILRLTIDYHSHKLDAFVRDESLKRESGITIPKRTVDTWQKFASELYHRIPIDYDWEAIAYFIINDTEAQGRGLELQQTFGTERKVYKATLPDACDTCKRLCLTENGTPRLFKIKELLANGPVTINQRIFEDSEPELPTCGPSHLYCNCLPPTEYTGYEPWAPKDPPITPLPVKKTTLLEIIKRAFTKD